MNEWIKCVFLLILRVENNTGKIWSSCKMLLYTEKFNFQYVRWLQIQLHGRKSQNGKNENKNALKF